MEGREGELELDAGETARRVNEEMAVDDSAFHAQVQRQSTDKPVSLHSGAPQLEGWMFKTPQHRDTKWQRRYCTLHLEKPARMYYFSKQADAAQMQLIGGAWDHTRELGDWDLKLNYPDIASVRAVP